MRDDVGPSDVEHLTISAERCRERVGVTWNKHGIEVIPAFVADMDFDPPPAVLAAIGGHVERGDLGYGPFAEELAPVWATASSSGGASASRRVPIRGVEPCRLASRACRSPASQNVATAG